MTRESRSRPRLSVPSQWAALPDWSLEKISASSYPYGAMWLERTASASMASSSRPPSSPSGFRRMSVLTLLLSHARIQGAIGQVHQEIREDHERGDEEVDGLNDGVVAAADRLEHEAAHAREPEDVLHDDRPAEVEG